MISYAQCTNQGEGLSSGYFCICGLDLADYPRMLKCI